MIQNRKSKSQLKLLDAQPRLVWFGLFHCAWKLQMREKKHTQALVQILSLRVYNLDKVYPPISSCSIYILAHKTHNNADCPIRKGPFPCFQQFVQVLLNFFP